MFSRLFRKDRRKQIARRLYDSLVRAARSPEFYGPKGVEDSVDGRFDMIVLHAVLLMRRLREGEEAGREKPRLLGPHARGVSLVDSHVNSHEWP